MAVSLAMLSPSSVLSEPFDFARVVQSSRVGARELNAGYGVEAQGSANAPPPGSGLGFGGGTRAGGGGGRPDGVTHRLSAFYGLTSFLSFGVEQAFRHADFRDFRVGVLAPQLRLRLPWLGRLPVELGVFFASRIRFDGPRAATAVPGVSLEKRWERLALAANIGFETSYATTARENGLRYDAGASYRLTERWSVALEYWAVLVWSELTTFRHEHHLSPLVRLRLGRAWVAAGAAAGVRDRAITQVDYGGLVQLGLALNL